MSKAKEMKSDEVMQVELHVLRQEHRDLDSAIDALACHITESFSNLQPTMLAAE